MKYAIQFSSAAALLLLAACGTDSDDSADVPAVSSSSSSIGEVVNPSSSSEVVIPTSSSSVSPTDTTVIPGGNDSVMVLWTIESPDNQVQVPCVIEGTPEGDQNNDGIADIYDCGGWWYGYGFGPEGGAVGTFTPAGEDGALLVGPNRCEVGALECDIPFTGVEVSLATPAAASDAPAGAGVGFQYLKPVGPIDLSEYRGYYIRYTSTASLQMVLQWDDASYGYDDWHASLREGTDVLVELPWDMGVTACGSNISGAWVKDGWATGASCHTIATAIEEAVGVQVRLKNGTPTAKSADLIIHEIGLLK